MKVIDHLSKDEKMKLERLKKLQKEKFSSHDMRDLMGTDRQTYKRKHGAITNK